MGDAYYQGQGMALVWMVCITRVCGWLVKVHGGWYVNVNGVESARVFCSWALGFMRAPWGPCALASGLEEPVGGLKPYKMARTNRVQVE